MIGSQRSAHPTDAEIAAWAANMEAASATAEHVADCAACQARLRQWQAVIEPLGPALRAEADANFPEGMLARQAAHVMRRLRGEPPARVLRFPAPVASRRRDRFKLSGTLQRWVAAAALAGVVVGSSVARYFDVHPASPARTSATATSAVRTAAGATIRSAEFAPEATVTDEAFLVELDAALVSRGPEPLHVLDALTPERDPATRPR